MLLDLQQRIRIFCTSCINLLSFSASRCQKVSSFATLLVKYKINQKLQRTVKNDTPYLSRTRKVWSIIEDSIFDACVTVVVICFCRVHISLSDACPLIAAFLFLSRSPDRQFVAKFGCTVPNLQMHPTLDIDPAGLLVVKAFFNLLD